MATTVRITETYDMKTSVGKMGLVGIHTPQMTLLKKLYPGLMKNHKFVRFVKCDVVGACASVLPADPLQVGVEAGQVAPEDMFNPILYKAVTNSSFDTLVARVRNLTDVTTLNSVSDGTMYASSVAENPNFNTYYSLLAENGEFKKAMPQAGFKIVNLVPLAHTVISTFGNVGNIGNTTALQDADTSTEISVPDMEVPELAESGSLSATNNEVFYRGKSIRMPKIPLHYRLEALDTVDTPNVPETHVLALVLPPAKLHEFWYRMRVSWTIRFEQVCSTNFSATPGVLQGTGASSYGRNYTYSSSKSVLEENVDSVVADGVDISKIMES